MGIAFSKVSSDGHFWKITNWKERGLAIDKLLDNNLGRTYKTYDHFKLGPNIATSVKSVDPMCKSYQIESKFRGLLNTYKRHLLRGDSKVFFENEWIDIQRKSLELVFPNVPFTKTQKAVLDKFIKDNKDTFDIVITILE